MHPVEYIMKQTIKKKKSGLLSVKGLILSFILLIVIATGFNTFLTTFAFKNIYVNSIISQNHVVGNVLKEKIELSLGFGKKIENFFGMEALLNAHLKYFTKLHLNSEAHSITDVQLLLVDNKGKVLYSTHKKKVASYLSDDVIEKLNVFQNNDLEQAKNYFIADSRYYIAFPIKTGNPSDAVVQLISFPEKMVTTYLGIILKGTLRSWVQVLLLSFVLLLLLFSLTLHQNADKKTSASPLLIFKTKKFSYKLFFIIALCQILFSFSQIHKLNQHYLLINQDKAETLNLLLKDHLENLLEKGLRLKNLNKTEQYIGNMIYDIPAFKSIVVSNPDGTPLYYATRELFLNHTMPQLQKIDLNSPPTFFRTKDLMGPGGKAGTISVLISKTKLNAFLKKTLLDSSTTVLISIFFCGEIMILFFIGMDKQYNKKKHQESYIPIRIIRPVAFFYFFAMDIVVSFIPLYMKDIYGNSPDFIISKNMSLGLPVTVQMIFTAISILIVGSWCDKKGWQHPFFYGLFLSALGFLSAFIFKTPLLFLFSLALMGFGYGLSYISAQNFVTVNSSPEKKAMGLSEYYAGCIAGSICGIATGGMLAEQVGFTNVFFIGFVLLLGVFLWAFFYMKPYFITAKKHSAISDIVPTIPAKLFSSYNFFFNKKIIFLLYLNIIPASIVLVGFMNYFIPVYLHNNKIPQSDIGRIFMIFGVCQIYISPFITKRMNTTVNSVNYIALGGTLGSISLLTFIFISGYAAIALSILFLGLSAGFNAVRNAYALNLGISRKIGEGKATSLIFFHARLGQALGPIVFVWFAVTGNESSGIIEIGIIFLLLSISFLFIHQQKTGKHSEK